ncbi:MAG: TlpA family protein disulfide reductase [Deltaproteobacteria bacterium]|nr:TlpA family protein disulfide reductase [Deltaproteobacteria bacterium]
MIAVAIIGLAACKKREPVPGGDIAAALTSPTIEGAPFDPTQLRGKPSIVMFVSPTCPHCVEQLPAAQKVAKAKDANVVAVFIVGKAENARGVISHTKFEGPALIDDGTLRRKYGVRAVPYTLVLGADGHAREALRGAQGESRLEEAVADAR